MRSLLVGQEDQQPGTPPVDMPRGRIASLGGKVVKTVMLEHNLEPIRSKPDMGGMGTVQPGDGVDREGPDPAQRAHQEDERDEDHPTGDRTGRDGRPRSHGGIRHNPSSWIQPISPEPPLRIPGPVAVLPSTRRVSSLPTQDLERGLIGDPTAREESDQGGQHWHDREGDREGQWRDGKGGLEGKPGQGPAAGHREA